MVCGANIPSFGKEMGLGIEPEPSVEEQTIQGWRLELFFELADDVSDTGQSWVQAFLNG